MTAGEQNKAVDIYKNRCKGKFINNYHYLAYYLDPRYKKDKFIDSDEDLTLTVYSTLENYAKNLNLIHNDVEAQELGDSLRDFRDSKSLYGLPLIGGKTPKNYWRHLWKFPKTKLLSEIGFRLLSMPSSSAGVERSFSSQQRLHSNSRNRITDEKIDKLMRIKWFLDQKIKEEKSSIEESGLDTEFSDDEVLNLDEIFNLEMPFSEEEINDFSYAIN